MVSDDELTATLARELRAMEQINKDTKEDLIRGRIIVETFKEMLVRHLTGELGKEEKEGLMKILDSCRKKREESDALRESLDKTKQ